MQSIEMKHFNFEEFQEIYGIERDFLGNILSLGMNTMNSIIPELRTSLSNNEFEFIKSGAHKLKGTALTLCCELLVKFSFELESSEKLDLELIPKKIAIIEKEIRLVKELIAKKFPELILN